MMNRKYFLISVIVAVGFSCAYGEKSHFPDLAVIPAPREHVGAVKRHVEIKDRAREASPDILFLGDSITEQWATHGKNVWARYFEPLKAFNAGIGGDRTEHILWRIADGGIAFKNSPKLCVLMIGTNNTGQRGIEYESPENTARGIRLILEALNKEYPKMKVLLVGILPRGEKKDHPMRVRNEQVNEMISKFNMPNVHYLDITSSLTDEEGSLLPGISPDKLHFNEKGYTIYAEAILPKVTELLQVK